MHRDKLEQRYIPLSRAKPWGENPKCHDLERLIVSIQTYSRNNDDLGSDDE